MSYGSKTDSEGKALRADGNLPVLTGEKVVGNKIVSLGMRTDSNGDLMDNQAELIFNQANGATFKVVFFDSDEKWAIDQTNATLLHICTKIVSEADYYAAIGNPSGFQEFITNISTKIIPQAAGKTFTMKVILKHNKKSDAYFPNLPKFPNFIELDGTTPSTINKTNPKYDIYAIPAATSMAAEGAAATPVEDVF
tara:strand:+ start:10186 stop:10770 length:585 start_codon:yes stop_codon:yes gene_type:complete